MKTENMEREAIESLQDDVPPTTHTSHPRFVSRGTSWIGRVAELTAAPSSEPPISGRTFVSALTLLHEQRALVKTIKNSDWLGLLWQMHQDKPFRTSLSLPPVDGERMSFFGRIDAGCVGLVYDLDEMNLEDDRGVFCWPSGYYAKTEHNMIIDRNGYVSLVGGREDALVSIEQLRTANEAHKTERERAAARAEAATEAASVAYAHAAAASEYECEMGYAEDAEAFQYAAAAVAAVGRRAAEAGRAASEAEAAAEAAALPLSYNEVSLRLTGIIGIVGVFVRSSEERHVRFALGVRSLLAHVFPSLTGLPLLRITPSGGAVEVSRAEQLRVLRSHTKQVAGATQAHAERVRTEQITASGDGEGGSGSGDEGSGSDSETGGGASSLLLECDGLVAEGRIPIDLSAFPELSVAERLAFHAAHGVSHASLTLLLEHLANTDNGAGLQPAIELGLRAAARAGNCASVRELIRAAAPYLLRASPSAAPATSSTATPQPELTPSSVDAVSDVGPSHMMQQRNLADLHAPSCPAGAEPDLSILEPKATPLALAALRMRTRAGQPPSPLERRPSREGMSPSAKAPGVPRSNSIDSTIVGGSSHGSNDSHDPALCLDAEIDETTTSLAPQPPPTPSYAPADEEADSTTLVATVSLLHSMCAAKAQSEARSASRGPEEEEEEAAREEAPPADVTDASTTTTTTMTTASNSTTTLAQSPGPNNNPGWSDEMLVALGAQIALGEFTAGRTTVRLRAACGRLNTWLEEATAPRCSSLLFRVQSWHETRRVEPESELSSFLCGRAVVNRQRFHEQLLKLAHAPDGLAYTSMLYDLVANLNRPCLRMRMLREVLGLDGRFSRDVVFGVVCLAFDIVEAMARGAPAPPAPHGLDLDGFDEGTRLEADALFHALGRGSEEPRPSDPVGAERRTSRVLSDSRHAA